MKRLLSILFVIVAVILLGLPPLADRFANKITERTPASASQAARDLHSQLWIADLHADALLWNRNLLKRNGRGHVDVPRLIAGNVALQAFTVVSKVPFGLNYERNDDSSDMVTFGAVLQRWPIRTWFNLTERAIYQAAKLHDFEKKSKGKFSVIKSRSDLVGYMVRRQTDSGITAGFLGLEGAQVLDRDVRNVRVLFDEGFRMMAPTHFFDTEAGGSAHGVDKDGLTELGKEMVRSMEELGMIVDLAHASPNTIDDVLAMATRPVLVSHTGVKGTCDGNRNISNRHIRGIAATGGVVGIGFFQEATCGQDVESIVEAIQYTVNLGGVEHVALGSDFDGAVETPFDATGLVELTDALIRAGFSDGQIELIMGGNVRRLLLEVLPE